MVTPITSVSGRPPATTEVSSGPSPVPPHVHRLYSVGGNDPFPVGGVRQTPPRELVTLQTTTDVTTVNPATRSTVLDTVYVNGQPHTTTKEVSTPATTDTRTEITNIAYYTDVKLEKRISTTPKVTGDADPTEGPGTIYFIPPNSILYTKCEDGYPDWHSILQVKTPQCDGKSTNSTVNTVNAVEAVLLGGGGVPLPFTSLSNTVVIGGYTYALSLLFQQLGFSYLIPEGFQETQANISQIITELVDQLENRVNTGSPVFLMHPSERQDNPDDGGANRRKQVKTIYRRLQTVSWSDTQQTLEGTQTDIGGKLGANMPVPHGIRKPDLARIKLEIRDEVAREYDRLSVTASGVNQVMFPVMDPWVGDTVTLQALGTRYGVAGTSSQVWSGLAQVWRNTPFVTLVGNIPRLGGRYGLQI